MLGTISYLPPMFGLWLTSELLLNWLEGIDFTQRETFDHVPTFQELQKAMALGAPAQAIVSG
jgi:hypothetical protein